MARVMFVLRPDRGGVFNHVARLSSALEEQGHDVSVCGPLAHRREDLSAELVPLEIPRRVSPLAHLRSVVGLGRAIRALNPDLIHAHGSQGGAVARLARFASPATPVIFTPHLYAFENYFVRGGQRILYKLVERLLAPLATRVLCVCEAERRLAEQIGPAARTRVVYNGIEPIRRAPVHPLVAELGDQGPVIVSVAELRASKGVVTLVEAMASLLERRPDCRLAIAGDGEERSTIERRVADLGIGHAVRLLGMTDGPAEVLAGAHAFVNPAYAEAFPYTVIEAMSVGLPIAATDVGGTNEAIEDRVTGLLVTPRDPLALATAVETLVAEPGLGKELGQNAERRFAERFTLEAMVAGTLDVYAELGLPAVEDPTIAS